MLCGTTESTETAAVLSSVRAPDITVHHFKEAVVALEEIS